ncbi:MAG: hypothetical protein M3350_02620 [Actinomycetota bacterium]|nr:hypothetical protein [Actinomycetota bacterium]
MLRRLLNSLMGGGAARGGRHGHRGHRGGGSPGAQIGSMVERFLRRRR